MTKQDVTETDKRLIAALRNDGRASVTMLADQLGVSRATVQSRIDRLVSTGVIRKFTIEVDPSIESNLIKAITMIQIDGGQMSKVTLALKGFPEISALYTTNGPWALIAQIQATSLPDLDRILREMREIPGLVHSQTSILLSQANAAGHASQ